MKTGTYNELVIPDLIRALEKTARRSRQQNCGCTGKIKAKHFINDHPYLFGSEYPFDSTGFESTTCAGEYAMDRLHDPAAKEFSRA